MQPGEMSSSKGYGMVVLPKGFVSYGSFTHVGFPFRTSVSPPTLYLSSLQLPLSPLSLSLPLPSRRSRVPASTVILYCHVPVKLMECDLSE
jgi:hypothetical protein